MDSDSKQEGRLDFWDQFPVNLWLELGHRHGEVLPCNSSSTPARGAEYMAHPLGRFRLSEISSPGTPYYRVPIGMDLGAGCTRTSRSRLPLS